MGTVHVSHEGQDGVNIALEQITPQSIARVFSVSHTKIDLYLLSVSVV